MARAFLGTLLIPELARRPSTQTHCLPDLASFPETFQSFARKHPCNCCLSFDLHFTEKQKCLHFCPHELGPQDRQQLGSLVALGTDQQRLIVMSRNHTGWPVLATSTELSTLSRHDTR